MNLSLSLNCDDVTDLFLCSNQRRNVDASLLVYKIGRLMPSLGNFWSYICIENYATMVVEHSLRYPLAKRLCLNLVITETHSSNR